MTEIKITLKAITLMVGMHFLSPFIVQMIIILLKYVLDLSTLSWKKL